MDGYETFEEGYGADANFAAVTSGDRPHILLMGPRRGGKSSIQRVVFHKMSPHETLFLESTNTLDIKYIANNSFVQVRVFATRALTRGLPVVCVLCVCVCVCVCVYVLCWQSAMG